MKEWDSRAHRERAGHKSERDKVGVRNMINKRIKRRRNVFRVESALNSRDWATWNTPPSHVLCPAHTFFFNILLSEQI